MVKGNEKGIIPVFNDYSVLNAKTSEFLYYPIEKVEAFAMRKHKFETILSMEEAKIIKNEIHINYIYGIQEPVCEHREIICKKY